MSWQVEKGIAEDRAIRVENGSIVAAKLEWAGELAAGHVVEGRLISRSSGSARGTARIGSGEEILVDRLPRDAAEGSLLRLRITRAAIPERSRRKRARAVPTDAPPAMPDLAARLRESGAEVQEVRRFSVPGWDELIAEATDGEIAFGGGSLLFAPTPALLAVDVDGELAPRDLALAAPSPLALALGRFDVGGSVVVDFPTLPTKAERRQLDERLAEALAGLAHERTAINGFGLVQIVLRLEGPSLLHRAAHAPRALAIRRLLRQAEATEGPGAILITMNPALETALTSAMREELERRTGRPLRIALDPGLALEGGFAQAAAP